MGEALARIYWIERQISAAGLQNAKQPDDHIRRPLHREPDHDLRPNSQVAQPVRQNIGPAVKLAVAQTIRAANHGGRVRPHRSTLGKDFVDATVARIVCRGVIPFRQKAPALGFAHG